ncbi:MAG: GDSL-type esterase/lipase family protein [Clostridiales bacterium]|nr:GDSL-type esterase/lipase family protein [Clostridiales bacterium]
MFIKYDNDAVRLTGRWYKDSSAAVATACGAKLEFSFYGKMAVMHFDTAFSEHPYPHIWIQIDSGARTEATVEKYMRVFAEENGVHTVTVIYKSAVEMQHRWHEPLVGKIAFKGFEADKPGKLKSSKKKYIEFIGDSITEGVLIDEKYRVNSDDDMMNRTFQDDATATYAYLTAQALKLEPLIMGYGAVGLTKSGCGSVPRVCEAYEYCFNDCRTDMPEPDYIVINHGANDMHSDKEEYLSRYSEFLNMVYEKHPAAAVFVLGAFCGWCRNELEDFVTNYNAENKRNVVYINTEGWVPPEPFHPNREGHKMAAKKLIDFLSPYVKGVIL